MPGWIVHSYFTVPGLSTFAVNVLPLANSSDLKSAPELATALCSTVSSLTQQIVWPTVAVSVSGSNLMSFIVIVTAVTIFPRGITIEGAEQAALALAPVAGDFAKGLFAIGLFGASVLAATVMPLTTSYAVCESFGWESGVSRKFSEAPAFMGLYTALIVVGAVVVLIPGLPLIGVILVFMLRLVNNPRIMGEHTNPRWLNVVAWGLTGLVILLTAILLGSTLASWLGWS